MAAPFEARTREEQRSVIRFLGSDGVNPREIHRRMKMQYGDACLSLQQVYNWDRKFKGRVLILFGCVILAPSLQTLCGTPARCE